MMKKDPKGYMKQALEQARIAAAYGEVPVGAVLVGPDYEIISKQRNKVEKLKDPSAHAEILAIRQACEFIGSPRLEDCVLYVTLEPCPMCAQAISSARIGKLYYGAYDPKSGGVDHGPLIYQHRAAHHKPEIYGGIMETECAAVLTDFFKERR
jgi:tRNA(adenine34) deaminase